tara:strand:- start:784 stop:1764 length:981 start_codon:yes stop_codon:yes gene_type:complete
MSKLKNQKRKFLYYVKNCIFLFIPKIFYRLKIKSIISQQYDQKDIDLRVNYYIKIKNKFKVSSKSMTITELWNHQIFKFNNNLIKNKKIKKHTTYFFDLYTIFAYFTLEKKIDFKFGDIKEACQNPTIVKSRPIMDSQNSIIMKLNKIRHFNFVNDTTTFINKKNSAVWRGYAKNSERREYFIKNYYQVPLFNIGQHSPITDEPWSKSYMPIEEQLSYKFIFCLEGADTATSMKWIMSSNSACVMPKPKYETWFMEGTLQPDFHYIKINDDFSDAEEKIKYYSKHTDKALKIITNAQNYVDQFQNKKREKIISILVMNRYFSLSGQ